MHLRRLAQLRFLNLFRTRVGDAGLASFTTATEIETLLIGGTRVTDAGMERLAGFSRLRRLSLFDTGVGDAGIEPLIRLPRLETALLEKSRVTEAGRARLRAALPNLRFTE